MGYDSLMPTRPSKGRKRPNDVNQLAARIVAITTDPDEKAKDAAPEPDTRNPAAVALSKLGASKGGKARAKSMSAKKRTEIAKRAAKARWKRKKRRT